MNMSIRISDKPFVNIPHETDRCKVNNRRYDAFIKACINDLKAKGETICFTKKHIEEISRLTDVTEICYDERNECYYVFSKK